MHDTSYDRFIKNAAFWSGNSPPGSMLTHGYAPRMVVDTAGSVRYVMKKTSMVYLRIIMTFSRRLLFRRT